MVSLNLRGFLCWPLGLRFKTLRVGRRSPAYQGVPYELGSTKAHMEVQSKLLVKGDYKGLYWRLLSGLLRGALGVQTMAHLEVQDNYHPIIVVFTSQL